MIDLWQEIYGTIKRNKLRTFLTGFAVAWGIFMLIVLLGAGNGIIHAFEDSFSDMALNSMRVYPGWTTKPYDGLKEGRSIDLDNRDLDATVQLFTDHVASAGAFLMQSATDISYGPEYVNLSLYGVHPNYVETEAVKTVAGRFINQTDINERRKVMVLHQKSVDILFGKTHTSPLGKFVNAGGVAYQVVGLYNDDGSSEPSLCFIPFSTLQTIYNKGNKLYSITFTTKNLTTEAANEAYGPTGRGGHEYSAYDVIKAIRKRAGLAKGQEDAYLEECKDDKDKMRQLIRNERRLELCFESFRFWDLRRWNSTLTETAWGMDANAGAYHPFDVEQRAFADYMTFCPIPYSEILKYDALKQNKGWK